MREIMDTVNDPRIEEVVFMKPAQIGGTEAGNNIIGYLIDQDPCSMLYIMPTLEMARSWSKERLAPMLRDTPVLRGKVSDEKSRDSENSILHKHFVGGFLVMAGANSAASLRSRPIRVVIFDEEDAYKASAGVEGSPITLGKKRQQTFWNRKTFRWSTPTDKLSSTIEPAYQGSDRRKFHVPCPKCGVSQVLRWGQVKWQKDKPETAYYLCSNKDCSHHWTDTEKFKALKLGKWIAERKTRRRAGFWINGIYSPWMTFKQMAEEAMEAEKDVQIKKVWVNTFLCETWEEAGLTIEPKELAEKREPYGAKVPRDVLILTAGVDVQDDRLEVEVMGWGLDEETWGFRYLQLLGSPGARHNMGVWKMLDNFLSTEYEHELGIKMKVAWACVDTGGHFTQQVYNYIRPRQQAGIYAVKGSSVYGKPIVNRAKKTKKGIELLMIGTDAAKALIYHRLAVEKPGPQYMHFPQDPAFGYDEEYFKQLTAEKAIKKKKGGVVVREWVQIRQRNEALDNRVYATAAFYTHRPKLEDYQAVISKLAEDEAKKKNPNEATKQQPTNTQQRQMRPKRGWVTGWK